MRRRPRRRSACGACGTRYCGDLCRALDVDHASRVCDGVRGTEGADVLHAVGQAYFAAALPHDRFERRHDVHDAPSGATADDATCYICLDLGAGPLVRACSCRGSAGWVHLECLVNYARRGPRWSTWTTCDVCHGPHYGYVRTALAWQCWASYVHDARRGARLRAAALLGGALSAEHDAGALSVLRFVTCEQDAICESWRARVASRLDLARALEQAGFGSEALAELRTLHAGWQRYAPLDARAFVVACEYGRALVRASRHGEGGFVLKRGWRRARRRFGLEHATTLDLGEAYCDFLLRRRPLRLADMTQARAFLDAAYVVRLRGLGPAHDVLDDVQHMQCYAMTTEAALARGATLR